MEMARVREKAMTPMREKAKTPMREKLTARCIYIN
jgi:hypothetical protein